MIIQKVLKGINGLNDGIAQDILDKGILSSWWRVAKTISPAEIKLHLNPDNLDLHLNHYHKPVPAANPLAVYGKSKFGEITPFISTTAGVVDREEKKGNFVFPPLLTAIRFATDNFRSSGYVFYCYVFTIGKKAVEFEQFAEEIRELNIYRDYQPYYRQGEVMAKVLIPSVQIEKVEFYDGPQIVNRANAITSISPQQVFHNPSYQSPEIISNIREVIL